MRTASVHLDKRIPQDEPIELRRGHRALSLARLNGAHKGNGSETPIEAFQHWNLRTAGRQPLRHWNDALQVEGGFPHTRAQCELQTKPLTPALGGQRAIAVNLGGGSSHAFLDGLAVVRGKSVHIPLQTDARRHAEVRLFPRQQASDPRRHELDQFHGARIHALMQRQTRRQMKLKRRLEDRAALVHRRSQPFGSIRASEFHEFRMYS